MKKELGEEMKKAVSPELIAHAWKRILLVDEVHSSDFQTFVAHAQAAGFLKNAPDLSRLVETP